MPLTARIRSSQRSHPIPFDQQVPSYSRHNYDHKVFWSQKSHKSAAGYNYILEVTKTPCLRRWLDFRFNVLKSKYKYLMYEPPTIKPNPERIWVLYDRNEPVATFTNAAEAWFIVIGARKFGDYPHYTLHYIDRTA
jgi:hypothetical protein